MSLIDIIIPAYKAQSTLPAALASVLAQSIAHDCTVYIINDGDPVGHWDALLPFGELLNIEYIESETNGGCGIARQAGIDQGTSEFIVFLDADDEFYHPYALEILSMALKTNPDSPLAVGNFVEIVRAPGLQFYTHKEDFVWMFGKIYRRDYLNKHGIRFTKTNANEDAGFNATVQLFMAEENLNAVMVDDILYSWNFNPQSITRINDHEYEYNQSVVGYTENMISTISFVQAALPFSEKPMLKIIEVMVNLYTLWVKSLEYRPEFQKQTWDYCYKFYKEYFRELQTMVEPDSMKQQLIRHMKNKAALLENFIPRYTIYQFLDRLAENLTLS